MILSEITPTASTMTLLYSNNAGNGASGDLRFINQSNIAVDYIQVAVTTNYVDLPTNKSFIMYNSTVPAAQSVGISEISLGKNQGLFVYSLNGTTNFTYVGNTF